MNKTAFCGVEFIVCMTFEACTTYPRSATWHTKGCHTIYTEASCTLASHAGVFRGARISSPKNACVGGYLHLRDRRKQLPFWDVVGASIKSIPTKYHTLGTTFTGCKSIIAAGVSRKRSRVALFEDPRFLFLGDNKSSKCCAILLLDHVQQGL